MFAVFNRLIDTFKSYLPLKRHVVNGRYEYVIFIKLDVLFDGYGATAWPINAMSVRAFIVISNPAPYV